MSLRFGGWLAMQQTAGRDFTDEQIRWLEDIRDHVAGSVSIEMADFEYAPFNQRGGLGKAYQLFGDELDGLLKELNGGPGGVAPIPRDAIHHGRKEHDD